jgi:heme-degrading monooxygenase HmoA
VYVVIFKATIRSPDVLNATYLEMAKKLREKAMREYGCLDFASACEGSEEIALSYWQSMDDIPRWKRDPEHLEAQKIGKERWYTSYQVEIATINTKASRER